MAPPQISKTTRNVPLKAGLQRHFDSKPLEQLQQLAHDRFQSGPAGPTWNPRQHGQFPRPASPNWLDTASEMERYVRSGESARDIVDFGLGELEGCGAALTSTVAGTARAIRHPVDTAGKLNDAYWASARAVSEFPGRSEEMLAEATQRKCRQFLEADNRGRGRMAGAALTGLGLNLAPYPKLSTVVTGASKLVARTLPRTALAESLPSLPLLARLRSPVKVHAPQAQLPLPRETGSLPPLPPERPATGFLGRKGWEMKNLHGPHPPQNSPARINGMHYTGHSLDQMRNRGIMPSVIENAIIHGKVSPGRKGCHVFSDLDNELRVVLDPSFSSIVTTMRGAR